MFQSGSNLPQGMGLVQYSVHQVEQVKREDSSRQLDINIIKVELESRNGQLPGWTEGGGEGGKSKQKERREI